MGDAQREEKRDYREFTHASSPLACNDDVFSQSLEANTILLHNGDRDVTRLARLDVRHLAGLPGMRAADDLARRAIYQFS